MKALVETELKLPGLQEFYRGKVRDVYFLEQDLVVMVTTDRLSAFDVVLPQGIPGKGEILNRMANFFLDYTGSIVPNWKIASPDPMVTIGRRMAAFPVEMVIRGHLTGHAWREYQAGKRELCGVALADGMQEYQAFPEAIITPTTKAEQGDHDADISKAEILAQGLVSEKDYQQLEIMTRTLFASGQKKAAEQGLILADTKYEFGKDKDGIIGLIDEIHTADSSRYFLRDGFEEKIAQGQAPNQLSKEFVRQWLLQKGFNGSEGQEIPRLDDAFIAEVQERYQKLYLRLTGQKIDLRLSEDPHQRIQYNVVGYLKTIGL